MSCNCTIYACLDVTANDCDSITTNLIANETGVWGMRYEFNGRWFVSALSVTQDTPIVLPTVFNESYIHIINFYNNAAEVFNDTCYTLDTNKIPGSNTSGSIPVPGNAVDYLAYIVVDGTPSTSLVAIGDLTGKEINGGSGIIDARLIGRVVTGASVGGQIYTPDTYSKPKGSNTFTFTNGYESTTGTVIILYTS